MLSLIMVNINKSQMEQRSTMKTGLVILNFNSWEMTGHLAQKASSFKCIDIVVVVDNVSTDDSYTHLKKIETKKIRIEQTDKNGGYSYGNNYGAKICKELKVDIMLIANPDVDVEETEIEKILNGFANRDYSILSGVEYCTDIEIAQPPLWNLHSYWDDFFMCFLIGRKLICRNKGIALDKGVAVQDAEIIKGSFFAIRLEDFLKVGGFDSEVFLYCEERILSRKIMNLGKRIGIVTDARYIHNHSSSISNEYKTVSCRMKMLFRSRLYYNKKYNQIGRLKYILLAGAMKISILEYSLRDWMCYKS